MSRRQTRGSHTARKHVGSPAKTQPLAQRKGTRACKQRTTKTKAEAEETVKQEEEFTKLEKGDNVVMQDVGKNEAQTPPSIKTNGVTTSPSSTKQSKSPRRSSRVKKSAIGRVKEAETTAKAEGEDVEHEQKATEVDTKNVKKEMKQQTKRTRTARKRKGEEKGEEKAEDENTSKTKKRRIGERAKAEERDEQEKKKNEEEEAGETDDDFEEEKPQKKKKRTPKKKTLPRRAASSTKLVSVPSGPVVPPPGNKYLGAHVSTAGGLHTAIERAVSLSPHCRAFAMDTRSKRTWIVKPLTEDVVQEFRRLCAEHSIKSHHILPHGSYLMNCGSPDPEVRAKSEACLTEEMQRCERLGIAGYNFHPGSTTGKISEEECMDSIAAAINKAHAMTSGVCAVLEVMAGQGGTVGKSFEQIKAIIDRVTDKTRVGVCLDTCHLFGAGYDVRTAESFDLVMKDFDSIIGLPYLRGMHLNDSMAPLGSNKDRHDNIGKGKIGKECFRFIMNDKRFEDIPLVLETPCSSDDIYEKEIKMLYDMVESS